jgi:DNA repair protein RadC
LTAESILKRAYSSKKGQPSNQETEKTDLINHYRGARCKVCLIKENDHVPPILINSAHKAYELVRDELAASDRETLLSIMLDTRLYLIGIETVAVGSINVCGSTVSEVFKSAILSNASCIILCHNHPSGDSEPSASDIEFTKNVIKSGNLLGIKVHDHLVVSSRGYVSMKERGLINVNEKPL